MIKQYLLLFLLLASSFVCAEDKSRELKAAFELYSKSIAHERVKLHSHDFLSANFEVLFIKRTDEQLRENIASIKSRINLIDYFSIIESSIEAVEEENAITLVGISKKYNKSKKLTYYFVQEPNKGWLINRIKNEIVKYPYNAQSK
mgnify:CR=1 FL=1